MSPSVLITPLLLLLTSSLLSVLWYDGAWSLASFSNAPLVLAHIAIVSVLLIGYYLIINKMRRAVNALAQQNNELVAKLETQTNLLHLETFQHRKTSDELHNVKVSDPLTNIYNQTYFQELLSNEIDRNRRYGNNFSILLIELDDFTSIIDMYGYEFGDFAMKAFAQLIAKKLRKSDLLARYDGRNFVIIAPNTDINASKQFADRLCQSIEIADIYYEGVPLKITLSIGVAAPCVVEELTVESITLATECALNTAKEQGRNQAVKATRR